MPRRIKHGSIHFRSTPLLIGNQRTSYEISGNQDILWRTSETTVSVKFQAHPFRICSGNDQITGLSQTTRIQPADDSVFIESCRRRQWTVKRFDRSFSERLDTIGLIQIHPVGTIRSGPYQLAIAEVCRIAVHFNDCPISPGNIERFGAHIKD